MRIFLLAVLVANGEAVCYCPQATTIVEQSCRDTGCTCTNGEASCGLQLAGGSVISNIFSRFANSVTRKEVTVFRRLKNPPDKPFVHTKNEFFQEVRSKIKEEGRDEVVEQVFEKAKEALTDNSINEYEKRNNYSTYSGFMKLACSTVSSATVCTNLTWRCCQKYAAATSPVVTDSCPTTGKCSAASLKACDTQECRCGMVNGSSVFTCGENCITTGRCPSYHICGDKECVCVSLTSYKCVSNSVANSAHGLSPFETLPLFLFLTALVVTELIN